MARNSPPDCFDPEQKAVTDRLTAYTLETPQISARYGHFRDIDACRSLPCDQGHFILIEEAGRAEFRTSCKSGPNMTSVVERSDCSETLHHRHILLLQPSTVTCSAA